MINSQTKEEIKNEARKFFEGASGCHDWTHVERVNKLAIRMGQEESADLDVLEIASLLHDIGRKEEMEKRGGFCHAEKGAELARGILQKYNFEKNQFDNIIHCIATHRFRKKQIPETIEAKILFDADKLDSVGAVGWARCFLFAGNAGSGNLYTGNEKEIAKIEQDFSYTKEDSAFLEYEIKLKKIKDKILTATGRKIAQQRLDFMEDYYIRFWSEVEGVL